MGASLPHGELAGLAAALCWAIGSLMFERIGRTLGKSAGAMSVGKAIAATAVLVSVDAFLSRGVSARAASGRELGLLAASGVVGIAIGDTAYFGALTTLGAPRAVLLLSSAPVFAVLLESAYLSRVPPAVELAGIAVTMAGIVFVLARAAASAGIARARVRTAVALGLLSGVCQGAGSLLSRAATRGGVAPLSAAWIRLVTAVVALCAAAAVTGALPRWAREIGNLRDFARIAGASLVGTVVGLWLSQIALAESASGGVAATLLATAPVFALPLAHALGRERATPRSAIGVAVAFGGIALLLSPR